MQLTESVTLLLGLIAGLSGLVLAWRSYGIQARASALNDIDQIRLALKEENERLGIQIRYFRQLLEQEQQKRAMLENRLEALEEEIRRLKHLESNI